MAKTLFIAPGPFKWASTRMRAAWIADHMEDALWLQIEHVTPAVIETVDNVIWCKRFDETLIEQFPNKRHIYDICDPVHWWAPKETRWMCDNAGLLTASNDGLADDLADFSKRIVIHVPDRLDLEHFDRRHIHEQSYPQRLIWYGASQNRVGLFSAFALLERLACAGVEFELTIMDDQPQLALKSDHFPIYHVAYDFDQEAHIIAAHSLAILPPYPGAWGAVKSNNRAVTAWACGLAVWEDPFDYNGLFELATQATKRQAQVDSIDMAQYDVRLTAQMWERLLK